MNFNQYKIKKPEYDISLVKKNKMLIIKRLNKHLPKCLGKDKYGLLMYHRGGGVKKQYRYLNEAIKQDSYRILQNQYDPYRSCFINLCQTKNGYLFYQLSETSLYNDLVITDSNLKNLTKGVRSFLFNIPSKTLIYNVELLPNKKGILGKSAGSYCKIFTKTNETATLVLPSGKKIVVSLMCKANVGIPSNVHKKLNKRFKAGTSRHLNRRPVVRGVAMNPIDHPHGGGEGKTSSGRPCVSPWGKLTKGVPTRKH